MSVGDFSIRTLDGRTARPGSFFIITHEPSGCCTMGKSVRGCTLKLNSFLRVWLSRRPLTSTVIK